MIETLDMQDRGVEIVDMTGIFNDFIADVVGPAVDDSGIHTPSR